MLALALRQAVAAAAARRSPAKLQHPRVGRRRRARGHPGRDGARCSSRRPYAHEARRRGHADVPRGARRHGAARLRRRARARRRGARRSPACPTSRARSADEIAAALQEAERPLVVAGAGCGSEDVLRAAANVAWALQRKGRPARLCLTVPRVQQPRARAHGRRQPGRRLSRRSKAGRPTRSSSSRTTSTGAPTPSRSTRLLEARRARHRPRPH